MSLSVDSPILQAVRPPAIVPPPVIPASPRPAASASAGYIAVLDPLRGLAALAVALFHFTHNHQWLPTDHWLARLASYGHHGVETFLALSGFVVPYAMWRGGYRVEHWRPYLGRRLLRIYPPFLVSVIILVVTQAFDPHSAHPALQPWALGSHLFLLNDLVGQPWLIEVYWTLALEVQFYLLAGLAWPLLATRKSWAFALFAAVAVAGSVLWPNSPSLVSKIPYFLLGIALFRQHVKLDRPLVSVAFLVILSAMIRWEFGLIPLIAASLPMLAKFTVHRITSVGQFLGRISYSLYLFHLLAGASFLNSLSLTVTSPAGRAALIPVALAISIGAAWLAWRWIESPAIAWSRRFKY